MIKNPVFIICYARSGSTLLTSIIDNHKSIQLRHENNIAYNILNFGFRFKDKMNYTDFMKIINLKNLNSYYFEELMERDVYEQLIIDIKKNSLPSHYIYETLIRGNSNKRIWGENSFPNAFCLRELSSMYPESVFIHLVRDPRDTVLSLFRKKTAKRIQGVPYINKEQYNPGIFRDWKYIAKYAKYWEYWNKAIIREKDYLPNYLLVRYEDLVSNPVKILTKCFNIIGVDYYPEVFHLSNTRKKLSTRGTYSNLGNPINDTAVSQFIKMPTSLINCIERYAPTMECFNYSAFERISHFFPHWLFKIFYSNFLRRISEKLLDLETPLVRN